MAFDLETITGSNLTRVADALARVTKKYFVETRTAIESLAIPAAVVCITVGGFSAVGDGGDIDYVRYSGTPRNHWSGIANDYLTRPNLALVKSLDGQWWKIVTQGRALKPECWGAKADYYLLVPGTNPLDAEQWWNWSINPTPTDNRAPITECLEYLTASNGQLSRIGGTAQLGYGGYYSSGPIDKVYRSYCMEGMGLSGLEVSSKLIFAAGSTGIRFGSYGEGARSISTIRNVGIKSLGYGGHTNDAHGIQARSRVVIEGCFIDGFGGNGIDMAADVGSGSEASCFVIRGNYCWSNRWNGIEIYGGDANAGMTDSCNFVGNYYYGLNDHAFLGNAHSNHHAASNGQLYFGSGFTPRGGPYRINSLNGPSTLIGCYSESDQRPGELVGHQIVIGGLHAAGFTIGGGTTQEFGQNNVGGKWFFGPAGNEADPNLVEAATPSVGNVEAFTGVGTRSNSHLSFGSGTLSANYDEFNFRYRKYEGHGFQQGHPVTAQANMSLLLTPKEWAYWRLPQIPPNNVLLPKGMYVGSSNSSSPTAVDYSKLRRLWVEDNPEALTYVDHQLNDLALATDGKSLGRVCITAGAKGAVWSSGITWGMYDTIQTAAGHVYALYGQPYDPDYWPYNSSVQPPATVRPTHTGVGTTANYDEPNYVINWARGDYKRDGGGVPVPEVNYTEHPTRGFYTWVVVDESLHPSINFTDREVVPHWDDYPLRTDINAGSGDTGTWMRNPTNGITYSCRAVPVRPTKIYDQTWSMPASTVEPTHTSGTVDVREPNPAPSGSEPADIPGYQWHYLHSNITPKYARVASPFFDGSQVHDVPSLADGAEDSFTITITGAQLGDIPSVTCSVDTQGMDIRPRISAADTMTVRVINDTGGTVDLASATWYGRAERTTV